MSLSHEDSAHKITIHARPNRRRPNKIQFKNKSKNKGSKCSCNSSKFEYQKITKHISKTCTKLRIFLPRKSHTNILGKVQITKTELAIKQPKSRNHNSTCQNMFSVCVAKRPCGLSSSFLTVCPENWNKHRNWLTRRTKTIIMHSIFDRSTKDEKPAEGPWQSHLPSVSFSTNFVATFFMPLGWSAAWSPDRNFQVIASWKCNFSPIKPGIQEEPSPFPGTITRTT